MRRRRGLWKRGLLLPARLIVAWLPVLVIALYGGQHLWGLIQFLLSPGQPITFAYEGQGGEVQVTADSYTIIPGEMRAVATGLHVQGPDGETLLASDRLRVHYENGVIKASAPEGQVRLTRLEDGSFAVQQALPPESDEESTTVLDLDVDRLVIDYEDQSAPGRPVTRIVADNIQMHQASATMIVSAEVSIGDQPAIPLTLQLDGEDRIWLDARVNNLDLVPLMPLIKGFLPPSVPEITASRAVVDGRILLEMHPDHAPLYEADLLVDANNLAVAGVFPALDIQASAQTRGTALRLVGDAARGGLRAEVDGAIALGGEPEFAAWVDADVPSRAALWPEIAQAIPAGVDAEALEFGGRIGYMGGDFYLQGLAVANSARYQAEQVSEPRSLVTLADQRLFLRGTQGVYQGVEIQGAADLDLASQAMSGFAKTEEGPIGPLAERYGIAGITGRGQAEAVFAGTFSDPVADITFEGSGTYALPERDPLRIQRMVARAHVEDGVAQVQRLTAETPDGFLAADGTIALDGGGLDLSVEAADIDLGAIAPDIGGRAYLQAKVGGTIANPQASGRVEAYQVAVADRKIPQAAADFTANSGQIDLDNLTAQIGAGRITGDAALDLETKQISGVLDAENIRLADYVDAGIIGWVDVNNVQLAGTLDSPRATGTVRGENAVLAGYEVDSYEAVLDADTRGVQVSGMEAKVGEGRVKGDLLALLDGDATGKFSLENVPLDRIPVDPNLVDVEGTVSGEGTVERRPDGYLSAIFDGSVTRLAVNDTLVGSGSINAGYEDGIVTASSQIGTIESYLLVDQATYDLQSNALDARGDLYNIDLQTITEALEEKSLEWDPQLRSLLMSLEGNATGSVHAIGLASNPDVAVEGLTASNLRLRGRDAGEIQIAAERSAGEWEVQTARWQAEDSVFALKDARFNEGGSFRALADLTNFDLTWVNTIVPDAPAVLGVANLTALAEGTLEDPTLRATLNASLYGYINKEGDRRQLPRSLGAETQGDEERPAMSVSFEEITLQDDQVTVGGQMRYLGFIGRISGQSPLDAFFKEDAEGEADFRLELAERSIDDFEELLPNLDTEATTGTVNGSASFSGRKGDFSVVAGIGMKADQIIFQDVETSIEDLDLNLLYTGDGVSLTGEAKSSQGGGIVANINASLPDVLGGQELGVNPASGIQLSGGVDINGLTAEYAILNAERATRAVADGRITLDGTAEQPRVGGEVALSDVDLTLPTEFPEGGSRSEPAIDPVFDDLVIRIEGSALTRIPLGEVRAGGRAVISGPLSRLQVNAPLIVQSGKFTLPTATVDLLEGGEVDVSYDANAIGIPPVRVNLDVRGETRVTARTASDRFESYDVDLVFRGNLLADDGIQIQASSDPSDLSQDEILAILGQRQLIEAFAGTALGGDADRLRDTVFTFVLPNFTRSFTQGLAQSLSLDYITLDYNPFDQAVVRAGKSLTDDLTLQFSRQLSEPADGRQKFELKLTYRLPLSNPILNRFRLGFGVDQDVPWKITLDYARRF